MITYTSEVIGTITIKQNDNDGKERKYKVQIRSGNCLAVFIYPYRKDGQWWHQLWSFFIDANHIKRMMKSGGGKIFGDEKIHEIRLNLYYVEAKRLLQHFVRSGYEVKCFYKKQEEK